MKYILLPIHPEWCCKLMNGDKETEVRRGTALYNAIDRLIKEQGKAPCLIYCTKGKEKLFDNVPCVPRFRTSKNYQLNNHLNGKVVAVFEASAEIIKRTKFSIRYTETLHADELSEYSCLNQTEMSNYLGIEEGTAIHIHDLKIFDEPKELYELKCSKPLRYSNGKKGKILFPITKAPQSFMYAEVNE